MKKYTIDSVDKYNRLYELKTVHPLVSVIDLHKAKKYANDYEFKFEIYGLFLKRASYCTMKYGRQSYDFQEGSVITVAPGQTVSISVQPEEISLDVFGIVFHPDLIYGTPLAKKILEFGFFNYSETESLHLSLKEREKFMFYYNSIKEEVKNPVDVHTATLISMNILMLLEHLERFYDRQFTTRHKVNSEIVRDFEKALKQFYSEENLLEVPKVNYFAEKAGLSVGYFSDLVKKETGMNAKDMISFHMISEAKRRLIQSTDDINTIAYKLGFEYPAHFSRSFKRIVGMSPKEFRTQIN